jgi:hypothetical protein
MKKHNCEIASEISELHDRIHNRCRSTAEEDYQFEINLKVSDILNEMNCLLKRHSQRFGSLEKPSYGGDVKFSEPPRPCAHCGASNIANYKHAEGWMYRCKECGIQTDYYDSREQAFYAWSRRTSYS